MEKIKLIFANAALRYLNNALVLSKFKTNKLSIYGKEYSKTYEYSRVELAEAWNILMYNLFK